MKIKICIKSNGIINLLMIILFCSFTILTSYSWGRYLMLACIGLIFCIHIVRDGTKYKVFWGVLPGITAVFALYAAMSSLWAQSASNSIAMGRTLLELLIMVFVLYNCYSNNANNIEDLLGCIKWSSYVISTYSILFYGVDYLMTAAEDGTRLENAYANINTIGMLAAVGVLLQIDEIIRERRWKWTALLSVPSICMIALSQSRKAFVVLLLGMFLCFMLHNLESKNILKTIGKTVLLLLVMIVVLYFIFSLPIFSGMMERMERLLASYTGEGKVDHSTLMRNQMVEIGWEQFLKTPLIGMGMANPRLLSAAYLGSDAYLHNNFIELLAGGGIVGFAIYYSMYAYLLITLWKLRRYANKEYAVCLALVIVLLIMDYGMVSYYQKIRYIYLMLAFLEVDSLKRKAMQIRKGEVDRR